MARKYGVNATKRYASVPQLAEEGQFGGRVKSMYDSYTLTADLASGDFIEMGELPMGARVIDVRLVYADLDASGGTIDCGWEVSEDALEAADADGFLTVVDVTSAGSSSMFEDQSSRPGQHKTFTAPVKVGVAINGDTDATTGTVHMEILYVID